MPAQTETEQASWQRSEALRIRTEIVGERIIVSYDIGGTRRAWHYDFAGHEDPKETAVMLHRTACLIAETAVMELLNGLRDDF